ncbi:PREDICTED: uncharacterized protein At4g06598 [Tarenaya hassleriana]|uniref:uncharacterized protein At4g06598 n=1 Tax=Tarenaya hassleriana TaxID=28532 RepID=UPI00053CA155|nr:PREDICTED: uncharacterized protein At4g06598 [Tarenaya hassleriana]XP_010543620.1 PREDICTED: uncharacterized protein At4g06598 [Tarenaya hassleriana]
MENPGSLSNVGSFALMGKQSVLPPRNPSRCISPSASEYIPGSSLESHDLFKSMENSVNHHHSSPDKLLADEQPAWLDDLLSEPESPIMSKGHRRSASDTATFLNFASMSFGEETQLRSHFGGPFCLFQSIDRHDDVWRPNSSGKHQDRGWQLPNKNGANLKKSASCSAVNKIGTLAPKSVQRQVRELKEGAPVKVDNDSKRAKQQNAHRARLRRLQYISELERNVQVLQAEGSEMSTAIHYLDQQLMMLSMENRALKQRLDSLAEIQKLKQTEQHLLEREIGKLRFLRLQQQQQQQQQPEPQILQQNQYNLYHTSTSRELESQVAALSI